MINSLVYGVLSSEVSVIVLGLNQVGYSTRTEFTFLRAVTLAAPPDKLTVWNSQVRTVAQKDRRPRGTRQKENGRK